MILFMSNRRIIWPSCECYVNSGHNNINSELEFFFREVWLPGGHHIE